MGEAKRRGTFEQRKAAAIEREQSKPELKYVTPSGHSVKDALKYLQFLAMAQSMNNSIHLVSSSKLGRRRQP